MNIILKIGMDVHSKSYTLCAMEPTIGAEDRVFGVVQVAPNYTEVIRFIKLLKKKLGSHNKYSVECGYEAGCLGYTLYHQLTRAGINVLFLHRRLCLARRESELKRIRVMLI